MAAVPPRHQSADTHKYSVLFVFAAGVLWSTVGLGIRLIEEATVWQILLYRSLSMSLFLYAVIRLRSGESPFVQLRRTGFPAVIAGLALVAAYSGGIQYRTLQSQTRCCCSQLLRSWRRFLDGLS